MIDTKLDVYEICRATCYKMTKILTFLKRELIVKFSKVALVTQNSIFAFTWHINYYLFIKAHFSLNHVISGMFPEYLSVVIPV